MLPPAVQSFGFCLDTGHANIAADQDQISAAAGDHLLTLHLNDNDGRQDNHRGPGIGTCPWPMLARWLRAIDYRGCLLYELLPDGSAPAQILARTSQWHASWWSSPAS